MPDSKHLRLDQERAHLTRGISNALGYRAIEKALRPCAIGPNARLVDIGCGRGHLWSSLRPRFAHYAGVDLMRHPDFPDDLELVLHNLALPDIPVPSGSADVVIACEVTPHLENPRLLFRELTRIAKPGGYVIVTNPNLLSFLSLMTLVTRQRFNAFQDEEYPQMITPILENDLLRMARENDLIEAQIFYVCAGRIAFTTARYSRALWRRMPRACSDNLGLIARKPG